MNRSEFLDLLFPKITDMLLTEGSVGACFFAACTDGSLKSVHIPSSMMADEPSKNVLAVAMRQILKEMGAEIYAFVSEAWITRQDSGEKDMGAAMRRYRKTYREKGWSPARGGGREEGVLIHVSDREGSIGRIWIIRRDGKTGKVVALDRFGPSEDLINAGGRFADLLPRQVH
jgi:hypothetical protein